MHRLAPFACLIALASPALAVEGVFVWNDPDQMAIRMASFDSADPAEVTSVKVLAELTQVSAAKSRTRMRLQRGFSALIARANSFGGTTRTITSTPWQPPCPMG